MGMFSYAVIALIVLSKLNQVKDIKKVYVILTVIGLVGLMPINSFWHLRQSNRDCGGAKFKPEFIAVSDYIKRDYDKVYIINYASHKYGMEMRSIYGYLFTDYELIEPDENNIDIKDKKVAVITTEDFDGEISGVELGFETAEIKVYISSEESETLKVNF